MTSRGRDTVLVTGGAGYLGWHLVRRLEEDAIPTVATVHRTPVAFQTAGVRTVDLGEKFKTASLIEVVLPRAIFHTAAMTSTGQCETQKEAAARSNIEATRNLVDSAASLPSPLPYLVYISTDLVFDGEAAPYDETAPTAPIMEYGRTKTAAESIVQSYPGDWTLVRPAILYGPPTPLRSSFLEWIRKPLRDGGETVLFTDEWRTPVLVFDVVEVLVRLLGNRVPGILHCGGAQRLSRLEMGEIIADRWGLSREGLRARRRDEVPGPCPRPRDVSLNSDRLADRLGFRPVGFTDGIQRVP